MQVCPFILNVLSLGHSHASPCCVPTAKSNFPPMYLSYKDLKDCGTSNPVKIILQKRKQLIFSKEISLECRGCKYCCVTDLNDSQIYRKSFSILIISQSSKCQLACSYCYRTKNTFPAKSPQQQDYDLMSLINQLFAGKLLTRNTIVIWSGGEPLLGPNWFDVMYKLNEMGVYQYINSNALIFSNLLCKRMPYKKKFKIICSLDSCNQETYKNIKGGDYFNIVINNLQQYLNYGIKVLPKYIILPENHEQTVDFLSLVRDLHISSCLVDLSVNPKERTDMTWLALENLYLKANSIGTKCGFAGHSTVTMSISERKKLRALLGSHCESKLVPDNPPFQEFSNWLLRHNIC
jgi:organic radical activating enzyme